MLYLNNIPRGMEKPRGAKGDQDFIVLNTVRTPSKSQPRPRRVYSLNTQDRQRGEQKWMGIEVK